MKQKLFTSILVFVILLVASTHSTTRAQSPQLPIGQDLQDALDAGLEQYNGYGVSAAVIVPGYQIWTGTSGVSHDSTPITPDTVFHAGSISKNFVATVVLQLVEEGLLSLDDTIADWLPAYPNIDGSITIRQLLRHRSGIFQVNEHPDWFNTMFGDPETTWTPGETLKTFVMEPYFPKGEGFHYSNANYILLGLIVEEATGSDIATELHSRLLDPLELTRTFVALYDDIPEPVAHGWMNFSLYASNLEQSEDVGEYVISQQIAIQSMVWIAGAIVTTPTDLAMWAHALYHEKRVLSQELLDQMLAFLPVENKPPAAGYGLGTYRVDPNIFGLEMYGHGGNMHAYRASSLYLPDYGISLSLMYNWDDDNAMMMLADMLSVITSQFEPTQGDEH